MAEVMAPEWAVVGDCAQCGEPAIHPKAEAMRAYMDSQHWPMPVCSACLEALLRRPV